MSFEHQPPSPKDSGDFDSTERLKEYSIVLVALEDQFNSAKKFHLENQSFKHLLFGYPDDQPITVTFALAKSYEDFVRRHEPVIEITIPVDSDDPLLSETKISDDPMTANFSIRNKMEAKAIQRVTFENFDTILEQEISNTEINDLVPVPHNTYRDLIMYGDPIPLRKPTTFK
jgi:hypothetical protein